MSLDEEDQSIGRMAREYQAAQRRLIALQGEATVIGKVLITIGQSLTFAKPSVVHFAPENMAKLNSEKILSLVREIETTWIEIDALKEELNSLGLTPISTPATH